MQLRKISDELKNLKFETRPRNMSKELIELHRVHSKGLYEEALRAVRLKEIEIDALENCMRKRDPLDPDFQDYVEAWNEAQNALCDLERLAIIAHDNYRLYLSLY